MPRQKPQQISVRKETYERLSKNLPRDRNGEIRRGALSSKMDAAVNAALDRAETKGRN